MSIHLLMSTSHRACRWYVHLSVRPAMPCKIQIVRAVLLGLDSAVVLDIDVLVGLQCVDVVVGERGTADV